MPTVWAALLVTVSVEVPIVAMIFAGQRRRMALCCLVTTSITNLTMNALLPFFVPSYHSFLLLGEFGALAMEGAVYASFSRPRDLPRALIAAGCANAASFVIGLAML